MAARKSTKSRTRQGKPVSEDRAEQAELAVAGDGVSGGEDTHLEGVVLPLRDSGDDPNDPVKETLLPINGMVRLTPRELEIIDHPAFQRLFEIFQLGQTNLVYRGATHMRGEHAIGCIDAAMLMVDAIHRNRARGEVVLTERWQRAGALSPQEIAFVRLGALLHDIGHLPAGHTLEDELGLLPKHDADERVNLLLDRTDWHGRDYRSMRSLIDDRYRQDAVLAAQRNDDGVLSASELLVRLISSDHANARPTPGTSFRVGVCRDIIGNTICADLIDYLHRDWLHIGKPREFDPRLLEYMQILSRRRQEDQEDRLVIHLGGKSRPRPDAVTAILDLLESRYQLAEIALFHRVKLAATGMLERVIAEYRDTFPGEDAQRSALESLIPDLLECSDVEVLKLLEDKLVERLEGDFTADKSARIGAAIDLARRLRVRDLHRDLHVVYWDDLPSPERAKQIAELYSGDPELTGEEARQDVRRAAESRLHAVRALEYELDLDPCSIVMYCPSLQMNSKIAEVGIFSRGRVDSLAKLDEDGRISGGHLRAQQERFRRLWRISFAIDQKTYTNLDSTDLLTSLRNLIDRGTLWVPDDLDDDPDDGVRDIAETIVRREGSPWHEHEIVAPGANRQQESLEHPGGAPSARSFISPKPKSS